MGTVLLLPSATEAQEPSPCFSQFRHDFFNNFGESINNFEESMHNFLESIHIL